MNKNKQSKLNQSFLFFCGLIFIGLSISGCDFDTQIAENMQEAKDKVASDFEDQYDLALKVNDTMQMCLQAQLTAGAFLQAKNEKKYLYWKKIEQEDCEAAGLR